GCPRPGAVQPVPIGSSAAQRSSSRHVPAHHLPSCTRRDGGAPPDGGKRGPRTALDGCANRGAARPYCVIPFPLPPPENPRAARAQRASQAGRRRFDPGGPLSWEPVENKGFFASATYRPVASSTV